MKAKVVAWLCFGLVILAIVCLGVYSYKRSQETEVLVEWSTGSELNTAGFNLYRSNTPTGPGQLLNKNLIPASTDAQIGGNYRYVDKRLVAGQIYYYYLEDVNINGNTTLHGPVMVKVNSGAKLIGYLSIGVLGVTLCGIMILVVTHTERGKGDAKTRKT